jgi:hypothetical protein
MIELLQDDLKQPGAGRRLIKERYSLENMLDRFEELYETVLEKN